MGRTWLTTPPGQRPETEDDLRSTDGEHYSPGFALPREPVPRTRFGRTAFTLALVVLFLAAGALAFRIMTAGEDFDPALEPEVGQTAPAPESTG